MHLLLIAPAAPPKNSPEAIQVRRFLESLDPSVEVTLVTTPATAGWQRADATLELLRDKFRVITLRLPLHTFTHRVVSNHRLRNFHLPDSEFWIRSMAGRVVRSLHRPVDAIYSRSSPFSSALLARELKIRLGVPWMMHLSDPWADSPYRNLPPRLIAMDRELEASCVADANLISVTTEGQANHYRNAYPAQGKSIIVSPNMMPPLVVGGPLLHPVVDDTVRLVYTGALYGAREPSTLLNGLRIMSERAPDLATKIVVDFFGNMPPQMEVAIDNTPGCVRHGSVSYETATQAQLVADVLVTIEPPAEHPLHLHFMPSKNLDYIACRKPILAITPPGSETARLCAGGHGWSVAPHDPAGLADQLEELVRRRLSERSLCDLPDLSHSHYRAEVVTSEIYRQLQKLASREREKFV